MNKLRGWIILIGTILTIIVSWLAGHAGFGVGWYYVMAVAVVFLVYLFIEYVLSFERGGD